MTTAARILYDCEGAMRLGYAGGLFSIAWAGSYVVRMNEVGNTVRLSTTDLNRASLAEDTIGASSARLANLVHMVGLRAS